MYILKTFSPRIFSRQRENILQSSLYRARMIEIVGASSGKLSGKTLAIKDNMHIAGVPMSCGSNFLRGFVSSSTATVVTRVLDAGQSSPR